MQHYLNFINNQWLASETGASFDVDNPATEAIIATVSAASAVQARRLATMPRTHNAPGASCPA